MRAYEYFKYLHLGIISDLKRKSLPSIAKVVGLDSEQGLHHFLIQSPWKTTQLENRRLEIILTVLEGREIDLKGWKNLLNNLRLILQPSISFNLIIRWLKLFPIPLRLEVASRH